MDNLLQKLRSSMAELSVQGDDFTRQMWQLYSVVGEFVDNQNPVKASSGSTPAANEQISIVENTEYLEPVPNSTEKTRPINRSSPSLKRIPPRHKVTLKSNQKNSPQKYLETANNPLLLTISAIEDQDLIDEYGTLHGSYHNRRMYHSDERIVGELLSDFERESVGYAGSNSIDSGYKSQCPTPDLESNYYLMEGRFRRHHSRIIDPNSRSHLNNLLHLRDSLIDAIGQCEPKIGDDLNNKSVRFNTASNPGSTRNSPATVLYEKQSSVSPPNKSILKDPICDKLKLKRVHSNSPLLLEAEIDDLLYGHLSNKLTSSERDLSRELRVMDRAPHFTTLRYQAHPAPSNNGGQRTISGKAKSSSGNEMDLSEMRPRVNSTSSAKVRGSVKMFLPAQHTGMHSPKLVRKPGLDSEITLPELIRTNTLPRRTVRKTDFESKSSHLGAASTSNRMSQSLHMSKQNDRCYYDRMYKSDYHVYEEIPYDLAGGIALSKECPPPLPYRQSEQFDFNHRGKQRGNLYALIQDQKARLALIESLQAEKGTVSNSAQAVSRHQ